MGLEESGSGHSEVLTSQCLEFNSDQNERATGN